MKHLISRLADPFPSPFLFNVTMLFFRTAVSVELIIAHGLKKIGIGVAVAETIPNPLHIPDTLNSSFAISANMLFPLLVILGLFTRLATLPILAVTLTGYFILHWHDALLVKDTPFVYSVMYLLILLMGPGKYSIDFRVYKNT